MRLPAATNGNSWASTWPRAPGFVSNFAFWSEAGYFDNAAETKPLLHLWSLAIEEQFYIFWPVLLGLAWKRKWRVLWVVGTRGGGVVPAERHDHPQPPTRPRSIRRSRASGS
jgi:peptidoglycan/LPS O-acetylase OafA/YrhL